MLDVQQEEIANLKKTLCEKISSENSMDFNNSANNNTEFNKINFNANLSNNKKSIFSQTKHLNFIKPNNNKNQNQNANQISSQHTQTNGTTSTFNSTSYSSDSDNSDTDSHSDSKTRKIKGKLNCNKKVKLDNQCEFCEFSSESLNGLRIHTGSKHGCKAIVSGVKCKKISCKTHEMIFDPRNRNGKTKKDKTYRCDMCQFSTFSENGVAIHKGKTHRCKYEDEYGDVCKAMNCTKHGQEYIFKIRDDHL